MKTETQTLPPTLRHCCADAATTAAILAQQDAQKSQEQAQASRRSHQQDHVGQLKRAAGKLKQMAQNTLASGIYQGALGLGSSLCTLASSAQTDAKLAGRWQSGGKLCEAGGRLDPFALRKEHQAADKAQIEAEAAKASALAQEAADSASAHQRVQSSLVQQLQKIVDNQAAAARSAIKL